MANKKKDAVSEQEKKIRATAFVRLLYGFLCGVVSVIALIACIIYAAPLYLTVGFGALLTLSVMLIVSGKNLYKNL